MNKRNIIIAVLVAVMALPVIFIASKRGSVPLYYESNQAELVSLKGRINSAIGDARRTIITETVKDVRSAVVGINVTEIRQYQDPFMNPFFDDPFFRQFFGNRNASQKVKSLGSGYIISPNGYILTNDHVAGNATEIVVTLTNGKHYTAKVVGNDRVSDVCLIKIDGDDFPYLKLGNSDEVIIGEWVIALGNPFGLFDVNNMPTVTVGVVSATGMNLNQVRDRYYLNMIQTDAAINGGNSGGPLVNSLGEVIGMNTIIYTAGGSEGSIGLGFAIPINKVKKIVDELKKKGKIERDFYTGISVQNIDEGIAKYFKLSTTKGVIVTKIAKNSPAEDAGIKAGDIILAVDNFRVDNDRTLIGIFQEYRTDQAVELKLLRDNEELTVTMKLEKR
jgi:serine protease Do